MRSSEGAAQASPENLLINPDGTITGAATGIYVTQNAAGSITVTTAGQVTGLAGRGIFAQQTATGTGAWEAALVNVTSPGDHVLMVETGHFASLWAKMAGKLGLKTEVLAHAGPC